jgi:16S rRNA processing protein RimM
MLKSDCFCVARITRKHGYKGDLKFILERDLPPQLKTLESVFVERQGKLIPFFLKKFELDANGHGRLKLEGIDHENEAQSFIKAELYIPKDLYPESDEFLFEDLIGFAFEDESSGLTGTVEDAIEGKLQDLLEVSLGEKRCLVPFVDDFIMEIDFDAQRIVFALPEGLLDIQ